MMRRLTSPAPLPTSCASRHALHQHPPLQGYAILMTVVDSKDLNEG